MRVRGEGEGSEQEDRVSRRDRAEHVRVPALDHQPVELALGHQSGRLQQRGVWQDAQRLADVLAHLVRVWVRVRVTTSVRVMGSASGSASGSG